MEGSIALQADRVELHHSEPLAVHFDGNQDLLAGPVTRFEVVPGALKVVVPVPLTYLALDGCAELVRTIDTVRERYSHPRLRIAMVVPTFYRRTRLAHEVLEQLKSHFPKEIAQTVVGFHVKIDEAQSRGLSVFEYAPSNRGAHALAALAEELEAHGVLRVGRENLRRVVRRPVHRAHAGDQRGLVLHLSIHNFEHMLPTADLIVPGNKFLSGPRIANL